MTKTVTFTAGAPGSGKSTVTAQRLAGQHVIDSDRWKQSHPDYDPKNPGALHTWSSKMATSEFFERIGGEESFVFDGTGSDTAKLANFINQANVAGFETQILYVKASLTTCIERNAKRERSVPAELVREKHGLIATSVDLLSGLVDRVVVVNND